MGTEIVDVLAFDPDHPLPNPDAPQEGRRDVVHAGADKTGHADNLPGAHLERHPGHIPCMDLVEAQEGPAAMCLRKRAPGRSVASGRSDDHLDEPFATEALLVPGPDDSTVPQHGNSIPDHRQLGKAMGDVDHTDALRDHAPNQHEQPIDLRSGERRGRLVEEEQSRLISL